MTALTAGVLAGLFVSAIHSLRVTPLILEAELYETQAPPAPGDAADTDQAAWAPEDGAERAAYTVLADLLSAVGFALLLAAGFALHGGPVDTRAGILWGLGGFVAFAFAPAFGLPPEPPGVAAAELSARQAWWLGTAVATAGGLALMVFANNTAAKVAGLIVIAAPHFIGAPHLGTVEAGALPAELAGRFVAASLVTSALFWVVLGGLSGWLYRRFDPAPAVATQTP